MPDQYGMPTEEEMRNRNQTGYAPPTQAEIASTQMAPANTYTNGNHIAGTNVAMSDQAYRELTQSGQQLATDRNVLGGGKYGIRGWMTDHPVGMLAAMVAAAAGGGYALGGAGAFGGGSAAGGAAAGGAAAGGAAAGGAAGGGSLAADFAGTQMGLGAAGNLAASGGIAGGAGIGAAGTAAGPGVVSIGGGISKYLRAGNSLAGLAGGGGGAQPAPQGGGMVMPQLPAGLLGSQMPAQQQQPRGGNLFVNNVTPPPYQPKPFGPKVFNGALIWT